MRSKPAIIIFAREPASNRTKTRLIPLLGARRAAALARCFALDALGKASRLRGYRLVLAGDASGGAKKSASLRRMARRFNAELVDQGGGSLGARMSRVLAPFTRDGALLMGCDTPTLPLGVLTQCARLLRRRPVVLGPSLDGGYYLVGVRGAVPPIFRGIRWGTGGVLADTVKLLRRNQIPFALGPAWYDVDRPKDLALLAAHVSTLARRPTSPNGGARRFRFASTPCEHTARFLFALGLLRPGR